VADLALEINLGRFVFLIHGLVEHQDGDATLTSAPELLRRRRQTGIGKRCPITRARHASRLDRS
jgi:hypothetical protein